MNAFNQTQLQEDPSGLLESCDLCNKLIFNWDIIEKSVVIDNGLVVCIDCANPLPTIKLTHINSFTVSLQSTVTKENGKLVTPVI